MPFMNSRRIQSALVVASLVLVSCSRTSPHASASSAVGAVNAVVGPEHGALVVVGGGALGPEIYARFLALAGGADAPIVVIPTAGGDSVYPRTGPAFAASPPPAPAT